MGHNDLVDSWYYVFYNNISDERIKRESTYLYVINFVRTMRRNKIKDKRLFLNILDKCENYSRITYQYPYILDLNNMTIRELEILLKKFDINFAQELESKKMNDRTLIMSNNLEHPEKLLIIQNTNEGLNIDVFDLRFIHLRNVIFNRLLLDFGSIFYKDQITIIKNDLRSIIPAIKLANSDFQIAILSDYAYLLALDSSDRYIANLTAASRIMARLESNVDSPFWNYPKYFTFGYIYYRFALLGLPDYRSKNADRAIFYFELALKEIPKVARHLREMIKAREEICEEILRET